MTPAAGDWVLPAGSAAEAPFDLVVTPESAGWARSSLRILTLAPGTAHEFATGSDEILVVPLSGSAVVTCRGETITLTGRSDVFAGPTDFAYLPVDSRPTLLAPDGGRFALCGARTETRLPLRHVPATAVQIELRGSGQSSRMVRNFATVDAFEAGAIIACEVVTPAGNWSSYPAHKHDRASEHETELEEIYYFEVAAGPNGQPGIGYHRTSSSPAGQIDVLHEVRDRDAVLVPFGWHGPCMAAPGFDLFYLNVMAGPERAWLISDHPDQAWVRQTWESQPIDPRLTGGQ